MIIITGLEMPNNCTFCPLCYEGVACSASDKVEMNFDTMDDKRNENCPLKDAECKTCKHRPYFALNTRTRSLDVYYPDEVCPYVCDDPYYSRVPFDQSFCDKWEAKDEKIPGNGEN